MDVDSAYNQFHNSSDVSRLSANPQFCHRGEKPFVNHVSGGKVVGQKRKAGAADNVNDLKSPFSVNAAPVVEYMDLKVLYRLQKLIQSEPSESRSCQQIPDKSSSLISSSSPWGASPGISNCQVDYLAAASTDRQAFKSGNISDFGFFEGGSFHPSNSKVGNTACDGKKVFSTLGIKQIDCEMDSSPGQISCITACSDVDGFFDSEPMDDGPTFLGGGSDLIKYRDLLHNNEEDILEVGSSPPLGEIVASANTNMWTPELNRQIVSEASDNMSSMLVSTARSTHTDLLQSELQQPGSRDFEILTLTPSVKFDERSQAQSHRFLVERHESVNQVGLQKVSVMEQGPAAESPSLVFDDASSFTTSSTLSLHRILLSYANYECIPVNNGKGQVPFLNDIHKTECNDHQCNCHIYFMLISHYDNCHYTNCNLCGPVRRLFAGDQFHSESGKSENGLPGAFCRGDSDGSSTDTIVDILPPPKRLKVENPIFLANGVSQEVASSLNQMCAPEFPRLGQWHDACKITADSMDAKQEFLCPTEDTTRCSVTRNAVTDNGPKDLKSVPIRSKELLVGCKQEGLHHTSIYEIKNDAVDNFQGLTSDNVHILCEGTTSGHKEEVIQVGSKHDPPKSEAKCTSHTSAPGNDSLMKSEVPKIQGVSLADFFTARQMREHLSSFAESSSKDVTGNTNFLGDNVCQLCACNKVVFTPAPIYCSSCSGRIKRSLMYYSILEEMGAKRCFCTACVKAPGRSIVSIHGASFSKANLQKEKNNEEIEESWVQCDKCECWQHQICALYNDKRDLGGKAEYICPRCCLEQIESGERVPLPMIAAFGAKDLPSTMLSDHVEKRLFRRLKEEREQRARSLGKKPDEVPEAVDLVVRVVLSVDKRLEVNQQFLDVHGEDYPTEFAYKLKVILLFQKIEGVDVCLFGMYVQEFGSECGHPNQRCVYISYLDSVKYFRPEIVTVTGEALRTFVYHEILIGYLDYCKKRGFATCYIWACPPVKGEDYILYCHPETQKTPKPDKLRQYKLMLKKALRDKVVVDHTNLYDHFFLPTEEGNTKITAARLPYFDGDYWSGAAEDISKKFEQEREDLEAKVVKKTLTKRIIKAMGHSNCSSVATKDILVMQKLGETILPVKEDFIIVHLQFTCIRCHEAVLSGSRWCCNQCKKFQLCSGCIGVEQDVNERKTHTSKSGERHQLFQVLGNDLPLDTEDKEAILDNTFFENRHTFLSFCQSNHYQFDTLRRAKHSSMMILYHLQKVTAPIVGTIGKFWTENEKAQPQKTVQGYQKIQVWAEGCSCRVRKCIK
ncbi:hypothetical protein RJ639_026644, partial [Escallonia herrerae]